MSAPDPGRLDIRLTLADGRIEAVDILSRRPLQIGRWFVGRHAETIPTIAGHLFGLCARSHEVAAGLAVSAASGRPIAGERHNQMVRLLAAERLFEHVRPLATGQIPSALGRPMRETAAGVLTAVAARAARLRQMPDTPGLAQEILDVLHQSEILAALSAAASDVPGVGDRLTSADDSAILSAIGVDPGFAARPALPGRLPETGPAARRATSNRMAARLLEILEAAEILADRRAAEVENWIAAYALAPGVGAGVVDSPRGRLHYRVETTNTGMVGRLDIVAPTEWNFVPGGPLVALLNGRTARDLAEAEDLGMRTACLLDPCVDFAVEAVHA